MINSRVPFPESWVTLRLCLRGLFLDRNQLTGEIPSQLGALTGLDRLLLGGNQLMGTIPSHLGRLTDPEWGYLERNQLTGEIPTQLGTLMSLHRLLLNDNLLTVAIPIQLGNMTGFFSMLQSANLRDPNRTRHPDGVGTAFLE
jgi:Leucine-rich repeat (LRR) protein